MKLAVVSLALLAQVTGQATPGEQCNGPDGNFAVAQRAYLECVKVEAAALETSGASPAEIAAGAKGRCASAGTEAARIGAACRTWFSNFGAAWDGDAGMDGAATNVAIGEVLAIRAMEHAPH